MIILGWVCVFTYHFRDLMKAFYFCLNRGTTFRHPDNPESKAFTLVELLFVLATVAILGAMLLPALAGTQSQSKVTACEARFRQWATTANLYANDNRGWLPTANTNPGGAFAWDVGTSLPGMLFPYGMDVPVWFCPMRPAALDNANAWARINLGHPIQSTSDLRSYWSRSFPGECEINDNYWVPRSNGGTAMFPMDYSGKVLPPVWVKASSSYIYGWPRRLHDVAVPYVPFVSDSAGSGQGNGLTSPPNGIGSNATNMSPNTAHFANGILLGVNLAFADGHVASHTPDQIHAAYYVGSTYWFY